LFPCAGRGQSRAHRASPSRAPPGAIWSTNSTLDGRDAMAKGQKKSNKEVRKPKKDAGKKKGVALAPKI